MTFTTWEDVLHQLRREDPKAGYFYMLSQYKGTPEEERSRFMTLSEAIQFVAEKVKRV